jgi:hypothetical protein
MQMWSSLRAGKLALGCGVALACLAATGCWNTKPAGSTISDNSHRLFGRNKETPKAGTTNTNTSTNANNVGGMNPNTVAPASANNRRISGNPPIDTTSPMVNSANATPRVPPPLGNMNPVQPAGGLTAPVTNNGITPIASNSPASSPPVNLPVNLNNTKSLPAPDPTPGAAAPPVVSMQDQDPSLGRRIPPSIPATELPPSFGDSSGNTIQPPPPPSPIRSIK